MILRQFNRHKRFLVLTLVAALVLPSFTAANQGYNFTQIDIPLEPITEDDSYYTEDLWEVTDDGVYDESGNTVNHIIEDEPDDIAAPIPPSVPDSNDSFEDYKQSLVNSWGGKKSFAQKRLSGVRQNLKDQKARFEALEEQIQSTQTKLVPIRENLTALEGQIDLINSQIDTSKDKIVNVEVMIAQKQIEIKDSLLFLQRSEVELDIQKEVVLDYIRLLYQEESKYFDLYDDGSSTIKLLLADASVSENLLGAEYFAVMEETGRKVFHDLENKRREQFERQEAIAEEQADLNFLYEKLTEEKRSFEETRLSKKQLLAETQGQEERYTLLLEEALSQQIEAAIAVQNLQDNIDLIEGKLSLIDDGIEEVLEADTKEDLMVKEETLEMMNSLDGVAQELDIDGSLKPFIWPVTPNKITAKFRDPTYPKKWGVHNAIDVRAKQYSEIRAPANAYVFQTKDNGLGYSYIVLAHKNNLVTVYGHVTEILVTAGTTVKQGDLIGLSGGAVGTKGAGLQTTGPHLHFEVYHKGEPVDPLNYLPIGDLPIEYIPDEHLHDHQH